MISQGPPSFSSTEKLRGNGLLVDILHLYPFVASLEFGTKYFCGISQVTSIFLDVCSMLDAWELGEAKVTLTLPNHLQVYSEYRELLAEDATSSRQKNVRSCSFPQSIDKCWCSYRKIRRYSTYCASPHPIGFFLGTVLRVDLWNAVFQAPLPTAFALRLLFCEIV